VKNTRSYKHGRGSDAEHKKDQLLFGELLDKHKQIVRKTIKIPNGIISTTTSENDKLVKVLQDHVFGMKKRFDANRAIRSWDPLFIALFEHKDEIDMQYSSIPNGVEAKLTSKDEKIIELIHAHDKTLHGFVNEGRVAGRRESPKPSWLK
jgi:hypothetical protein